MKYRHLDYPDDVPPAELGRAALDDLLDRGDLESWGRLAHAVRADPHGELAQTALDLCEAHYMYGTSTLWRTWIERLRSGAELGRSLNLSGLRRARGLTQSGMASKMQITQSDVSKLERRRDVRLSTLRAYAAATGGRVRVEVRYPDGTTIEIFEDDEQSY